MVNLIDKPFFLRQLSIGQAQTVGDSVFRINNCYGDYKKQTITRKSLDSITLIGKIVRVRKKSNKMCFILLRDGITSIQVMFLENEHVTREYIKTQVATITPESVVKITGSIVSSPCIIESATLKHWEMKGIKIEPVANSEVVPLQIYKPDAGLDARLNHRYLDLRTMRSQVIFRLQHEILKNIHDDLDYSGFIQIFTPKIMEGVAESGSEVFKLDYFGKPASLAQSPQLFKQMAINSGMCQVYEIGPVFRAEKSNGTRHLTQYTSVDIELEFSEHYHQVINTLYELLLDACTIDHKLEAMWIQIEPNYEKLIIPELPIIIPYAICVKMLQESTFGCQRPEDINHQDEFNLGLLIKETYNSDIFIIDEYPKEIRPFYTYVNEDGTTRSYDFILRGCEILSGAQRINDYDTLVESAKNYMDDSIDGIKDYLESFKYGSPPHGGGAFGLERLIAKILDIENIRETSMFPRDPGRLNP
jgi:aspartyl-tRNA synthetase